MIHRVPWCMGEGVSAGKVKRIRDAMLVCLLFSGGTKMAAENPCRQSAHHHAATTSFRRIVSRSEKVAR